MNRYESVWGYHCAGETKRWKWTCPHPLTRTAPRITGGAGEPALGRAGFSWASDVSVHNYWPNLCHIMLYLAGDESVWRSIRVADAHWFGLPPTSTAAPLYRELRLDPKGWRKKVTVIATAVDATVTRREPQIHRISRIDHRPAVMHPWPSGPISTLKLPELSTLRRQRFQRPEAQKPAEPWDTATIRIAMSEKKGRKARLSKGNYL